MITCCIGLPILERFLKNPNNVYKIALESMIEQVIENYNALTRAMSRFTNKKYETCVKDTIGNIVYWQCVGHSEKLFKLYEMIDDDENNNNKNKLYIFDSNLQSIFDKQILQFNDTEKEIWNTYDNFQSISQIPQRVKEQILSKKNINILNEFKKLVCKSINFVYVVALQHIVSCVVFI